MKIHQNWFAIDPPIKMISIEKYISLVETELDVVHIFTSFSGRTIISQYEPFRPVYLEEEQELGLLLYDQETNKITKFYSPPEGKSVIGVDVDSTQKYLLVSLAYQEPDTLECVLINFDKPNECVQIDCSDLWYCGYGSSIKFGNNPNELLIIDDEDNQKFTSVDIVDNKLRLN